MFGNKKPERKAISLIGFGCFRRPTESRVESEICRSSTKKFARGIENQLAKTELDHRNVQVSDNEYLNEQMLGMKTVDRTLSHAHHYQSLRVAHV